MKKFFKVLLVFLLIIAMVGSGYFTVLTLKQDKELKNQNLQLQTRVSELDPEIGEEKNGTVYVATNWLVYDSMENANIGKNSVGKVSDIIQDLILNNTVTYIDLRNSTKIGLKYVGKNTYETYDGVHKQVIYWISTGVYIVPAES